MTSGMLQIRSAISWSCLISSFTASQMRPDAGCLERLRRSVTVAAVQPDGSGGWTIVNTASKYRRVTVQVSYTDGQNNTAIYAELSRVFSYVPITP